jgi:hypothetical protein
MRVVLEPITKVTLNLYSKDVAWFKRRYPIGYTEEIRDAVRAHILYTDSWEISREEEE